MKKTIYIMILVSIGFASCENNDWEFPDYEYQSVYFAHQTPVRTIILGEDIIDTSLDNEWKFNVMATTGGVYNNDSDVRIGISVSNELCAGLTFQGAGNAVTPLPDNYYTLASDEIIIKEGQLTGGVEVQLTQDFFNDPLAISNNYVLPLVMTGVSNADSILSGVPLTDGANRVAPDQWVIRPKDYVLYAVKYINPWHGFYLRRGRDVIDKDGEASTEVRHQQYVEYDEVYELDTRSLSEIRFPLYYKNQEQQDLNLDMRLVFNESNDVTVSEINDQFQISDSVRVYNFEASGSGKFIVDGEKKSWGDQDRDGLYLQYEVSYVSEVTYPVSNPGFVDTEVVSYTTTDTLVMRNRGVTFEPFTVVQ